VEWGPASPKANDYSVSFTRQIVKQPARGDQQIWALFLNFQFSPIPEQFKAVPTGNKWFRSLEDTDKWNQLIYKSKLFKTFGSVPANRVLTSYTRSD
jgi:hypothetical protein